MRKLLLVLLAVSKCGWQDPGHVPPEVLSTSPVNGGTGFALNQSVTATFSTEMDTLTINTSTFKISGVSGSVSLDSTDKVATFAPSENLSANTKYTATLTTGAENTSGVALAAEHVWSFTTGSSASPTVSSTTPEENATGVPRSQAISAIFSTAMKTSTVTTSTLSVAGVTGSVAMSNENKTATFTPSSLLAASTTFTVTISTGVQDADGNPMQSAKTWSFTTGTNTH